MKRNGFFLVVAALALGLAGGMAGAADLNLYVPDMTDARFAEAAEVSSQPLNGLPQVVPFWTDLVNTEAVGERGEGVYVAVLDTGLLPAASFFFPGVNIAWDLGKGFTHDVWWDDGYVFGPLREDRGYWTQYASGHGTHVASTVVGFNYNNLNWINGVAPKATIIPVLVLDAWVVDTPAGLMGLSGGTDEMIAAGIRYVADLAESLDGPVVINMSLGGPVPSQMIEAAVDYAISHGVVVVASAGNDGSEGMGYPGGLEQIISAGAAGWASMFLNGWTADVPERLNQRDELGNNWQIYLEDFSGRPNKYLDQKHQDLDVSAPGAWVVGPYKPAFSSSVGYYYLSGTSMAAPHVSGMAALVLEDYPGTMQWDMEFVLELAAAGMPLPASDAIVAFPFEEPYYYTATWDGGDFGSGYLRADQAIRMAKRLLR